MNTLLSMRRATAISKYLLKDCATIAAGYPLRSSVDSLPMGDVAVLQMGNANPDVSIDWAALKRVELPSLRHGNFLQADDVIFSTRGSRNFALALDHVPLRAVCSPHFFVLRVNNAKITPAFLAWQMNQSPAQTYFGRSATGSDILNIRREALENLSIAVPSLADQHTICALDRAACAERYLLNQLIANRNRQLQAIALDLHRPIKESSK